MDKKFGNKQKRIERSNLKEKSTAESACHESIVITRVYHSAVEYAKQLRDAGYSILDSNVSILEKMGMEGASGDEISLKKLTTEELGLPEGGQTEEILNAAKEQGLEPCPGWAMFQYRMTCTDGESVNLGGKIPDLPEDEDADIFYVARRSNGERWLNRRGMPSGNAWSPNEKWIFMQERKEKED